MNTLQENLRDIAEFRKMVKPFAKLAYFHRNTDLNANSFWSSWMGFSELPMRSAESNYPALYLTEAYKASIRRNLDLMVQSGEKFSLPAELPMPLRPAAYVGRLMADAKAAWDFKRKSDITPDARYIGRMEYENLGRYAVMLCSASPEDQQELLGGFMADFKVFVKWLNEQ